jgi:hypothetical protein
VLISEPSNVAWEVDKEPLAAGPHAYTFGLQNSNRTTLQWIVHAPAGGVSATIALYVALTEREADLTDLDPATNPYWSPLESSAGVALTFPHQPGAVVASCALPIGPVSLSTILAIVTVAGGDYGSFSLGARTTG